MKRLAAVLACAALCACAGPKGPKPFTYATTGEVTSLDPVIPYDADSQGLIFNIYDTLLAFQGAANDVIVPRLATEVPTRKNGGISKDGRVYRFHIRTGVRFHDGTPLTPDDVRYSLLRFMLVDRDG
ncbi:MAG: ABC transporter substrate-binding protein, partial [Elusimicrobia bacterium]|nr:ABC transporter substrate-binding protein [Elusimicrobiota bacterium]